MDSHATRKRKEDWRQWWTRVHIEQRKCSKKEPTERGEHH